MKENANYREQHPPHEIRRKNWKKIGNYKKVLTIFNCALLYCTEKNVLHFMKMKLLILIEKIIPKKKIDGKL